MPENTRKEPMQMKRLIVLALMAAVALCTSASVSADELTRVEAETMTTGTFAVPVADAAQSPSGTGALKYEGNGTASKSVTVEGTADTITVQGRINPTADSRVCVQPRVNGALVAGGSKCFGSAQTSYTPKTWTGLTLPKNFTLGLSGTDITGNDRMFIDYTRVDGTPPPPACVGTPVSPTQDLKAVVAAGAPGTTFCLEENATYNISDTVVVDEGKKLLGAEGSTATIVGPEGAVTYGQPTTKLVGNNVVKIIDVQDSNSELGWLDVSGADAKYSTETQAQCANWGDIANKCPQGGTGVAIGAGNAAGTIKLHHLKVHNNDAVGIANMNGVLSHSELYSNTENADWLGFTGAGVKGIKEYEAHNNFIHDEQGNGLWYDHSALPEGNVPEMQNGAWMHNNILLNNDRWGLRYENSPRDAAEEEYSTLLTWLAEDNVVAGNGADGPRGGASMADAQSGTFRSNYFGPVTFNGVTYGHNATSKAIVFSESGRNDRPDLWGGVAENNTLNGEVITNCDKADTIVKCTNNN